MPAQHRFSWLAEHEGVERGWGYCPGRDTALAEAQEAARDLLGVIVANCNIRRILSAVGFVGDGTFRLFATGADAERSVIK